jgi:hypothetical protein
LDASPLGLVSFTIVVAHILATTKHLEVHGLVQPSNISEYIDPEPFAMALYQDFMEPQPDRYDPELMDIVATGGYQSTIFAERTLITLLYFVLKPRFVEPLVLDYYYRFLRRDEDPRVADAGGFANWTTRLETSARSAEQVVAGFISSQEYFDKAQ